MNPVSSLSGHLQTSPVDEKESSMEHDASVSGVALPIIQGLPEGRPMLMRQNAIYLSEDASGAAAAAAPLGSVSEDPHEAK